MDDSGKEHDVVHTNHSGAIIALETKLGTGDSNATANAVLIGTGSGTSGWDTTPTFTGLVTASGGISATTLTLTDTTDTGSDTSDGALNIGATTGQHLAFDNNEIISKTDDSTVGDLHIQTDGGDVKFGNNTELSHFKVCSASGAFEIHSSASALEIHDTAGANQSGYIGYYNNASTRLGYVGYPANDDLYIKQEDGNGDLYLWSENGRIYYFADTYHFWKVAGNYELRLDGSSLIPYTNEGLQLGASGKAWDKFWLGQASTFSSGGYYTLRSRDSDRQVMEYVSSERYKKDIEDLPLEEAYQILDARPIKFRGIDDDASVPLEAGLSAESLHDAGYEYAVRYDEGHWGETPRGIYYDQLVSPLIKIVNDLKERIEVLEG
jgi:hypothetical protein